jgi:hypothetical protein
VRDFRGGKTVFFIDRRPGPYRDRPRRAGLVTLDLPGMVRTAGYPGPRSYGSTTPTRLRSSLHSEMRCSRPDLVSDASGDLDLHAIMHWARTSPWRSTTPLVAPHRTRRVLSFFAQDRESQTLVYVNAELTKDPRP